MARNNNVANDNNIFAGARLNKKASGRAAAVKADNQVREAVKEADNVLVLIQREAGCDPVMAGIIARRCPEVVKVVLSNAQMTNTTEVVKECRITPEMTAEDMGKVFQDKPGQGEFLSKREFTQEEIASAQRHLNEAIVNLDKTYAAWKAGKLDDFIQSSRVLSTLDVDKHFSCAYIAEDGKLRDYDGEPAFKSDVIGFLSDGVSKRTAERYGLRQKEKKFMELYELQYPEGLAAEYKAAMAVVPKVGNSNRIDFTSAEWATAQEIRSREVADAAEKLGKPELIGIHEEYMGLSWVHDPKTVEKVIDAIAMDKYDGFSHEAIVEVMRFYLYAQDILALKHLFVGDDKVLDAYAAQYAMSSSGATEAQRTEWRNEKWFKDAEKKFNLTSLSDEESHDRFICAFVENVMRHYGLDISDPLDTSDSVKNGGGYRSLEAAIADFYLLIDSAVDLGEKKTEAQLKEEDRKSIMVQKPKFGSEGGYETCVLSTASLFAYVDYLMEIKVDEYVKLDIATEFGYSAHPKYLSYRAWKDELELNTQLAELRLKDTLKKIDAGELNRLVGDFAILNPTFETGATLYDKDGIGYHSIRLMIMAQTEKDPAKRKSVLERSARTDAKRAGAEAMSEFYALYSRFVNNNQIVNKMEADSRRGEAAVSAVLQRAIGDSQFRDMLALVSKKGLKYSDSGDEYSAANKLASSNLLKIYECVGALAAAGQIPTLTQLLAATATETEAIAQ